MGVNAVTTSGKTTAFVDHLTTLCRLLLNEGYMTEEQRNRLLTVAKSASTPYAIATSVRDHLSTGRGVECIPPAKRMIHLVLEQHTTEPGT